MRAYLGRRSIFFTIINDHAMRGAEQGGSRGAQCKAAGLGLSEFKGLDVGLGRCREKSSGVKCFV